MQMRIARLCAQRVSTGDCLLALTACGLWYSRPGLPSIKFIILCVIIIEGSFIIWSLDLSMSCRLVPLKLKQCSGLIIPPPLAIHLQSIFVCIWTLRRYIIATFIYICWLSFRYVYFAWLFWHRHCVLVHSLYCAPFFHLLLIGNGFLLTIIRNPYLTIDG